MYDHIGLRVRDLEASVRFYTAALAPLGHVAGPRGEGYAGLGPPNEPALWLYASPGGEGCAAHVAFKARNRAEVDAFHRQGLQAGGRDNGTPGIRTDYGPTYYAAFLSDLDGHNVEAVCTREPAE